MVKKKSKSKRQTLKDKYKIQHRVVETHRKRKKQAKRDAKAGIVRHDKKKKDPGIPNSWPFKEDLLNQISRSREREEEKKRLAKEQRRDGIQKLREHKAAGGTARTLEELMARAGRSREEFAAKGGGVEGDASGNRTENKPSLGQSSRRAYMRILREVVDSSDVILQVLDARDPAGTRVGRAVEEAILSRHDKRMVLVLNKIDLVPKDAVAGWLAHLRRSHPTLAMKAGTNQSRSAEVGRTKGESALKSSSGVGVEGLLSLLKNYARSSGEGSSKSKSCITVGIIGYPNVGKSSILNTLKRSRAVGVSPRPGFTTSLQEVVLDKSVRLVDSPGVVFDDSSDTKRGGDTSLGGHSLLRNCVDADAVDDPIPAVRGLLERCTVESLVMTYEIPAFPSGDVMTFLALVARRSGRKLKGGIPDKVGAARTVLRDWNAGKIKFYTSPPDAGMDDDEGGASAGGVDATIVSSFGEAFDVSKMKEMDRDALEGLPEDGMDFVEMKAPSAEEGANDGRSSREAARYLKGEVDDDDEMDEDSVGEGAGTAPAKKGAKSSNDAVADAEDYDFDDL
eukprot:CAMPEP_0113568308 /NCGR_PEP_ID=MMETSP0015_2-20120614/23778_1 /TAXON_ID=2838 /ORGANISM="Odontella" /LENGTH=564 /DNA_ID=CAMNT_0000470837 /DNA_START=61 /DNA_END=1755 /DNA_ORIENTATION=+ /assembly_acc=CAM_ASM_000160